MNELVIKPDDKMLAVLQDSKRLLQEIEDISELLSFRAGAKGFHNAWEAYYRATGQGYEQMFAGWEAKVRGERRMGELLKSMAESGERVTSRDNQYTVDSTTTVVSTLEDLGITYNQSSRYQKLAEYDDAKIDKIINEFRGSFAEPTTKALFASLIGAHVGHSSGEDEWYTPEKYIESAKATMGSVDLDPASCSKANELVGAKTFFSSEDDGLSKDWFGNVWMNPPYSQPDIKHFSDKFVSEFMAGKFKQGCVLVNNATETEWLQNLLQICTAACFIKRRVHFIDINGKPSGSPLQGQVVLYFGNNSKDFADNFKDFGTILWKIEG